MQRTRCLTAGDLTLSARNAVAGEIDIAGEFVVLTVADTGTGIDPELDRPGIRTFFHDEACRAGHRSWAEPGLWAMRPGGWYRAH